MDRTPRANRNPATPSPISSSPAVQESPFSNFLRNLSPINTETAASHSQRLLGTNLPTPQVVFTSPHINLQRGNSFLERDDRVEAGSDVYKECNTTIVQNLSFEEVQLCSPSGSVDKYLADPEEADCTKSAELHSKATDQVPRFTACKESNTENEPLALSDKTEEALSSLEMSEAAINQRDGKTTEQFPRFTYENVKESDINVDLFSGAQNCGANAAKVNLQSAGCQSKEQNASGQSYEDSNESSRKALKGPVKESGQNQRGIRRHLQFEAEKAYKVTILGNSGSPCSLGRDTTNLRSPSILKNSNSLASSHFDTRASSSPQALSSDTSKFPPSPYESFRSTQIGVNSATSALIHSGIGLHLNHIARCTSTSSDIFSSKKSTGYLSTPEQMLEHDHRNNIAVNSSRSLTSAVFGEIYSHVANSQQEFQAVAEASSFAYHCTDVMKPPCDSMQLILVDQEAAPCESGMSASQAADKVEELIQLSPKRKRRKAAYMSEECKRCTCKRSKCLKLYCECFAAGVYCVSSCACENCYNKPEFEDTVLDIRHQIESRNPLAFAPKVVDNANNSLANFTEDRNLTTPSSARHKRGCNCKKSKCLKKYCECYQAKVGCSSGCRCDCCQNTFGTKADAAYNRAERWETHPAEKLDTVKGVVDCIKAASINQYSPTWAALSDISNLTPLSHPSASSSIRNFAKIPQAQARSSQLQPSRTGRFDWGCSPVIVTPQLSEGKGPHGPSSDGARHDITDDDDASEILKETYPTKVVKGSSPNQKRVSPPQSRSRLRPSSPTGLRSGRKFILQAVPSFPPLTPYSTSKEGTNEIGNDDKATNKNNWTTQKELGEA